MKRKWLILVGLSVLAGCMTAPVPLASPDADAASKKFQPPVGKANLYVAWSGGPSAVHFKVAVDGKNVASIEPGTFYLETLDPGQHYLTVSSGLNTAREGLNAEAGKNYYYEVTSSSDDYTAKPSLGLVITGAMGKLMVNQNKLVAGE